MNDRALADGRFASAAASAPAAPTSGALAPAAENPTALPFLPPAMRPWRALFEAMPPEHVGLLAQLVNGLASLLDPARPETIQSLGDPDGLDGFSNRGEMDRLLLSEWLWQDLNEQEFLRRIMEREALFNHLALRSSDDRRGHCVIVDAGPWMLGRPRLITLAALLVLHFRAQREKTAFFWTSTALGQWHQEFTRANVQTLLSNVASQALTEERAEQIMAGWPKPAEIKQVEWRILAHKRLAFADPKLKVSQVVVEEEAFLDPEGAFGVRANVSQLQGGRLSARQIALPGEEWAAAMLRAPFRAIAPPRTGPQQIPPRRRDPSAPSFVQQAAAFSHDGRYLIIAQIDGVLIVEIKSGKSYFRPLERYDRLVGIHASGGGLLFALGRLYSDYGELRLEHYWSPDLAQGPVRRTIRLPKDSPAVAQRYERSAVPLLGRPGAKLQFFAICPTGESVIVTERECKPFQPLAHNAVVSCSNGHVVVWRRENALSVRSAETGVAVFSVETGWKERPVLGADDVRYYPDHQSGFDISVLAVRMSTTKWACFDKRSGQALEIDNPEGWRPLMANRESTPHEAPMIAFDFLKPDKMYSVIYSNGGGGEVLDRFGDDQYLADHIFRSAKAEAYGYAFGPEFAHQIKLTLAHQRGVTTIDVAEKRAEAKCLLV